MFMFVDQICRPIDLVQKDRNLLMPNMPEFRDNFVAALNKIVLFEVADKAVMFTHFVLVVMATNYLFSF